jgi:hypothetical protein
MFPLAEQVYILAVLEHQLRKLYNTVMEEQRFPMSRDFRCRELGRAHGFVVAMNMIDEQIGKLVK